ncbi:hypothetical protein ACFV9C_06855 [Kribbella sp. NPDC059898]|uniref:hypothetical protein n=1 Tax=Kribbella sp. NPDC059898 TaxID=3346995 RepID=UPI0036664999
MGDEFLSREQKAALEAIHGDRGDPSEPFVADDGSGGVRVEPTDDLRLRLSRGKTGGARSAKSR